MTAECKDGEKVSDEGVWTTEETSSVSILNYKMEDGDTDFFLWVWLSCNLKITIITTNHRNSKKQKQ